MTYETSPKVFSCCGQYIAPTKSVCVRTIKCPRCHKILKNPIKYPSIVIVKQI